MDTKIKEYFKNYNPIINIEDSDEECINFADDYDDSMFNIRSITDKSFSSYDTGMVDIIENIEFDSLYEIN